MRNLPEEEWNGRDRWPLGVAIALSGHLDFRTLSALRKATVLLASDCPVHASRKRKPPIQRQLGGGGSGMPRGSDESDA